MPKKSKLFFICESHIVHFCLLPEKGLFLARLRRGGYNVIVYSKDYEAMKEKFIAEFRKQTAGLPNLWDYNRCETKIRKANKKVEQISFFCVKV